MGGVFWRGSDVYRLSVQNSQAETPDDITRHHQGSFSFTLESSLKAAGDIKLLFSQAKLFSSLHLNFTECVKSVELPFKVSSEFRLM